jgi:hypothetical protein
VDEWCERHQWPIVTETDLVITKIGPNGIAVMAALRGPLSLSPLGAGELVRGGAPIWLSGLIDLVPVEKHLKLCGATTERVVRSYCWQPLPGDPVDDGAIA